ncbi:MAG TPA: cupin domain-containing protein [Solirubrobacteraceae bacterium]|nr:cupin domain-containing protein [Solirubrobacteraceae bacterium]
MEVAFARIDPDRDERFQTLRRELGVTGFGINALLLQPGERGRVHSHDHQEEVYLVLEGELTLVLEDGEHLLARNELARVPPEARRQLVNAGSERVVLLALGGSGEHRGRDGRAWGSWEEEGEGRSPQEVPLPADLPPRA